MNPELEIRSFTGFSMTTDISQSQEDYIKTIWEFILRDQKVIRSRIAENLDVSLPAVTSALNRLQEAGYVSIDNNDRVTLTDQGKDVARDLLVRHNLVEKLLVEVVGVEWYNAHEEAERIEHVISENVEQKLLELFGEDAKCPHGSPVQEESLQHRRERGLKLLSECEKQDEVQVEIIVERDREFLKYMDDQGIHPGSELHIQNVGYDGVMEVRVKEQDLHLGESTLKRIWVKDI